MTASRLGNVLQYLRGVVGAPAGDCQTDAALLERFLGQQDEAAFDALVRRHGPLVLGVARGVLQDAHDADDVFQATFLVLARKVQTLRRRDSLASWLYGISYRIALNARGRAARRRKHERRVAAMAPTQPEANEPAGDLRPLIAQELDRLPEKYRAPLVLCYLQGMTNEEAAEQLRWPSGTVKGRLARAREVLRGRLSKRGLAVTTTGVSTLLAENALIAAVPPALTSAAVQAALPVALGQASLAALNGPAAELAQQALRDTATARLAGFTLAGALLLAGSAGTLWLAQATTATPVPAEAADTKIAGPRLVATFAEARHYGGMPLPVAVSADGKRLAVLSQRDTDASELFLQDIATGKMVATLKVQPGFRALASDGQALALVYGTELDHETRAEIHDLVSLKRVRSWKEKTRVQPGEAYLAGDRLLLAGGSVEDPPPFAPLNGGGGVGGFAGGGFGAGGFPFAPFGVDGPGALGCYDLTGKAQATQHALDAEDTLRGSAVVTADGKPAIVLLVQRDETTRIDVYDPVASKTRKLVESTDGTTLAATADGRTLAVQTAEATVQLLDGRTGKPTRTIGDGDTTIVCLAFSPDGHTLATAGSDRQITLWDVRSGKPVQRLEQPRVQRLCFSADGRLLAAGSPEEVKVWTLSQASGGR